MSMVSTLKKVSCMLSKYFNADSLNDDRVKERHIAMITAITSTCSVLPSTNGEIGS